MFPKQSALSSTKLTISWMACRGTRASKSNTKSSRLMIGLSPSIWSSWMLSMVTLLIYRSLRRSFMSCTAPIAVMMLHASGLRCSTITLPSSSITVLTQLNAPTLSGLLSSTPKASSTPLQSMNPNVLRPGVLHRKRQSFLKISESKLWLW